MPAMMSQVTRLVGKPANPGMAFSLVVHKSRDLANRHGNTLPEVTSFDSPVFPRRRNDRTWLT